jgi:hypothetical protein
MDLTKYSKLLQFMDDEMMKRVTELPDDAKQFMKIQMLMDVWALIIRSVSAQKTQSNEIEESLRVYHTLKEQASQIIDQVSSGTLSPQSASNMLWGLFNGYYKIDDNIKTRKIDKDDF